MAHNVFEMTGVKSLCLQFFLQKAAKVNVQVTHRSIFPAYELFQTFKELLLITVSKTFVDEDVLVRMTMT